MTTPTNREQEKDGGSGLEPCPFCGSPAELDSRKNISHDNAEWWAHCRSLVCYAIGPKCTGPESARLIWNNRRYQAQAPAIEAVVEAYSRALTAAYENQFRTAWDVLAPYLAALAAVRGGSK